MQWPNSCKNLIVFVGSRFVVILIGIMYTVAVTHLIMVHGVVFKIPRGKQFGYWPEHIENYLSNLQPEQKNYQ